MKEEAALFRKATEEMHRINNPALNKYFWDHTQNASDAFKLKRLLEYASFPDMLKIPFDFVKLNINSIDISHLRTSQIRSRFVERIQNVIKECNNWDDTVFKIAGIK